MSSGPGAPGASMTATTENPRNNWKAVPTNSQSHSVQCQPPTFGCGRGSSSGWPVNRGRPDSADRSWLPVVMLLLAGAARDESVAH